MSAKVKKNLEELLLYYQLEKIRSEIELIHLRTALVRCGLRIRNATSLDYSRSPFEPAPS